MLAEYRGPYELLRLIQPGRHLRCLDLYGFDGRNCGNATHLLESLRPFRGIMKHVEYLDLSLRDVSEPTFSALCSMFVGVKSLHLLVSDNDGSDLGENLLGLNLTPSSETTINLDFVKKHAVCGITYAEVSLVGMRPTA